MKKIIAVSFLVTCFGCVTTPTTPEKFGTIKSLKQQVVVDEKTGVLEVKTAVVEEKAEKSVVDKGSDALLTPQKVVNFGQYFSSFDLGPDNSVLVEVYNNQDTSDGSDLWVYKSGKIRLTNTDYLHKNPSFSADGKNVYFTSRKGKKQSDQYSQDSYVWRMPSSGNGGITRIGSPAYEYKRPQESKSGEFVLFTSRELYGNNSYIWYMQPNGSLPTQLKQGTNASWLDDETIIFDAEDENTGFYTIWTCKIDGSMLTQIITDNKQDCIMPSVSPDGAYITYVKQTREAKQQFNEYADTRDIYIHKIKDGLSQQITTNLSRDDAPKWSPDGEHLYFRSSRGVGWNIWRISTNFLEEQ